MEKENNTGQGESQNREIKFRAWNGKKMYSRETIMNLKTPPLRKIMQAYNFMQYTGLKDKNGVEIYEGDILQYYMGGKKMGGKVHYNGGSFWVTFYRTPTAIRTQIISAFLSDKRTSVILGNIYENPELL